MAFNLMEKLFIKTGIGLLRNYHRAQPLFLLKRSFIYFICHMRIHQERDENPMAFRPIGISLILCGDFDSSLNLFAFSQSHYFVGLFLHTRFQRYLLNIMLFHACIDSSKKVAQHDSKWVGQKHLSCEFNRLEECVVILEFWSFQV